jgi:hypothetical protein
MKVSSRRFANTNVDAIRVNICPFQGSRTIRTEEAVLISLARLSPFVAANSSSKMEAEKQVIETNPVEFSDESPSDESSSSEGDE